MADLDFTGRGFSMTAVSSKIAMSYTDSKDYECNSI